MVITASEGLQSQPEIRGTSASLGARGEGQQGVGAPSGDPAETGSGSVWEDWETEGLRPQPAMLPKASPRPPGWRPAEKGAGVMAAGSAPCVPSRAAPRGRLSCRTFCKGPAESALPLEAVLGPALPPPVPVSHEDPEAPTRLPQAGPVSESAARGACQALLPDVRCARHCSLRPGVPMSERPCERGREERVDGRGRRSRPEDSCWAL